MRGCPQKVGTIIRLGTISPKKPNSATRHLAKVKLSSGHNIRAVIPGSGYDLHLFNTVWIHAKRARDMPGVHYRLIRGKGDLSPPDKFQRQSRRSIFSLKNWTYLVLDDNKKVVFVANKSRSARHALEREAGLPLTWTRNRYYFSRFVKSYYAAHPAPLRKRWLTRQDERDRRRRAAQFSVR